MLILIDRPPLRAMHERETPPPRRHPLGGAQLVRVCRPQNDVKSASFILYNVYTYTAAEGRKEGRKEGK
jgi:hypothetical protein